MQIVIDIPEDYYKAIKEIPVEQSTADMMIIRNGTPQPKTGWIPVSERLPEESLNSVIGWDTYRERCVFVQYIDGHFQITGSNESFNIVAWMPLPEPYKAESEVQDADSNCRFCKDNDMYEQREEKEHG